MISITFLNMKSVFIPEHRLLWHVLIQLEILKKNIKRIEKQQENEPLPGGWSLQDLEQKDYWYLAQRHSFSLLSFSLRLPVIYISTWKTYFITSKHSMSLVKTQPTAEQPKIKTWNSSKAIPFYSAVCSFLARKCSGLMDSPFLLYVTLIAPCLSLSILFLVVSY